MRHWWNRPRLVTAVALLAGYALLSSGGAAPAAESPASKSSTGDESVPRAASRRNPALVVIGIVVREAGEPLAILEDFTTKKHSMYRVGSPVGDGRVTAITPDRVTIAFPDGQVELRLGAGGSPVAPPPSSSARTAPGPTAPSPTVSAPPSTSDGFAQVGREQLKHLVEVLGATPQMTPVEDRGVRIGEVRGDSPLELLGLRQGDLVRDVNGRAPGPQASFGELIRQAGSDGIIRIHVERDGKPNVKYVRVVP